MGIEREVLFLVNRSSILNTHNELLTKNRINSELLNFVRNDCNIIYFESLPLNLEYFFQSCIFKNPATFERDILISEPQVLEISNHLHISLQEAAETILIHEFGHRLGDIIGKRHDEEIAWNLGTLLLPIARVSLTTYSLVKSAFTNIN